MSFLLWWTRTNVANASSTRTITLANAHEVAKLLLSLRLRSDICGLRLLRAKLLLQNSWIAKNSKFSKHVSIQVSSFGNSQALRLWSRISRRFFRQTGALGDISFSLSNGSGITGGDSSRGFRSWTFATRTGCRSMDGAKLKKWTNLGKFACGSLHLGSMTVVCEDRRSLPKCLPPCSAFLHRFRGEPLTSCGCCFP
jgi:hypothetical protein